MTELPNGYIRVLDHGYVGLVGVYGDDRGPISPPAAARVSFKKDSSQFPDEQNDRLTHYLLKNEEFACLRHNVMTFELRAPLFVMRQWWKYIVGSNFTEDQLGWNENSKRYITEENEFYIPDSYEWRSVPENKKQGSGESVNRNTGLYYTDALTDWVERGEELYQQAQADQIAPELARLFTANGNYVTSKWTTSLNALLHFLDERLDEHAQYEIRMYAEAVLEFFKQSFPVVYEAWQKYREEDRSRKRAYKTSSAVIATLKQEIAMLNKYLEEAKKPWYKKIRI